MNPEFSHQPDNQSERVEKLTAAEAVERLRHIDVQDANKIELLLVMAGEKPATDFRVIDKGTLPDGRTQAFDHPEFDQLAEWADKVGLAHEVLAEAGVNDTERNLSGGLGKEIIDEAIAKGNPIDVESEIKNSVVNDERTLYVARDAVWLEKLKHADRQRDPALMGECFGFPESSVQAYLSDTLAPGDTPSGNLEADAFRAYMVPESPKPEDFATSERWASAIKRLDPELYQRTIDRHKQMLELEAKDPLPPKP